MKITEEELRSHRVIARLIASAKERDVNYDLINGIVVALNHIRHDEREFWLTAIKGAIELCAVQDKKEAAAVLQAFLESAEK